MLSLSQFRGYLWSLWPALTTGLTAFAIGYLTRIFLSKKPRTIVASPLTLLLPSLSEEDRNKLPYPPDALPGARDVTSPYGSIRFYEWGPEDGRNVLFVHGTSTPCLSLGPVAHGLVEHGCRVMLFDLFGRGYSDVPLDLPQDNRLFSSQILLALASSPLSWTGSSSSGLSLVGYSLGGGIATAFTANFPHLISSLVLIAPGGLIRPHLIDITSRVLYSEGIIPESIVNFLVRRRMKSPSSQTSTTDSKDEASGLTAPVSAELPNLEESAPIPLSKSHPDITIVDAVNFQVDHHRGFVQAFISSVHHGPIFDQHEDWKLLGRRLTLQNSSRNEKERQNGLQNGKILIFCGNSDPFILVKDFVPDATAALEGNVSFKYVDAGHEVPLLKTEHIVEEIWDFWHGPAVE